MPHKFKIGQPVEYHPPHGIYAPRGAYLVTAKLPERDGEFEYHIRSVNELHERLVRERELSVIAIYDNAPGVSEPKKPRRK
jgi:hypothetical protein